jgi:hypothetical protein
MSWRYMGEYIHSSQTITTNNNQFARELKKLLIKGCYYSIQEYLNEEFSVIGY